MHGGQNGQSPKIVEMHETVRVSPIYEGVDSPFTFLFFVSNHFDTGESMVKHGHFSD
jgi:hypothetical protein